ncbi:MAG TPA: hypothetical protein VHD31_03590 [Candidatus Paceibacterota bacterium]|nr:hypothetical protein [Candidatus Paceibacterota bacterium]
MEDPSHFQPTYEHKHWHWLLWLGLFTFALLAGGFVYVGYFQNPQAPIITTSVEDSSLPSGADPQTFQVVGMFYTKDATHVWTTYTGPADPEPPRLVDADPATFQLVQDGFEYGIHARDKNNLFWGGDNVTPDGFDIASMQIIGNAGGDIVEHVYIKDKDAVYAAFLGSKFQKVSDADPATFILAPGQSTYDAQDKNHKYLRGKIVE